MESEQLERARLAIEEYRVLHAENLQRNRATTDTLAGGMVAIVALIGFGAAGNIGTRTTASLIVLVIVTLAITSRFIYVDNKRASKRIIEIEEYINRCIGGDTINPLSWERRFGLGARDYLTRFWTR